MLLQSEGKINDMKLNISATIMLSCCRTFCNVLGQEVADSVRVEVPRTPHSFETMAASSALRSSSKAAQKRQPLKPIAPSAQLHVASSFDSSNMMDIEDVEVPSTPQTNKSLAAAATPLSTIGE